MSIFSGPELPNSGLIMMLDVSNPKSYNPNLITTLGSSNCPFINETKPVTADVTPIGTTELCKHTLTGAVTPFTYVRADRSLTAGTYTMSAWIRATTSFSASFAYVGETTNEIYYNSAAITPIWTRFTLTFTLVATQTLSRLQIFFSSEGNDKIISVWGCELIRGSAPTANYIDSNYRGNTWQDISGNGNHVTVVALPTYNAGVMQFNGTTQYAYNTLNLSAGTSTVIAGARYIGSTGGRVISSYVNNWLLGFHGNALNNFYSEGWVYQGNATKDTAWKIYAGTADVPANNYNFYNGKTLLASNNIGSAGMNGLCIGSWSGTSQFSTCEVSFVLAYNRVLTESEIQQTFNAYRGRFDI